MKDEKARQLLDWLGVSAPWCEDITSIQVSFDGKGIIKDITAHGTAIMKLEEPFCHGTWHIEEG